MSVTATPARSDTADWLAPGLTLGQAARSFCRQPSPRILFPAAAVAVAARVAMGRWSKRDAIPSPTAKLSASTTWTR